MIKTIALKYNDLELYKLACELEKVGVTNPMQMQIQKGIAEQSPIQGLHYDRLTSLAGQAKSNPEVLNKMRQAGAALKSGGVTRLDDVAKKGLLAATKKPTQMAQVINFRSAVKPLMRAVK